MESLEPKLMSAIRHALWELVMEKITLVYPLFDNDSSTYHAMCAPNLIFFPDM